MLGPAAGLPSGWPGLLATEMVPVADVRDFAKIYAYAMIRLLG
jgi:hypothetical protein